MPDLMLSDNLFRVLSIVGLLIFGVAGVLAFTGRLGHWPLTAAVIVLTISSVVLMYLDDFTWHRDHPIALAVAAGCVGVAIWQAVADSRWSMVALTVVAGLQCLLLIGILLFLYIFRLDRLW